MTTSTHRRTYSIKEAAALTGLPASTLRYYESVGVIAPVSRGASSGHRVYDDADLDQLLWVACLAATGMSMSDMRAYVANNARGDAAAGDQAELLERQERHLAEEARRLELRQRYVRIKVAYWRAVEAGDTERAAAIGAEARTLADELRDSSTP